MTTDGLGEKLDALIRLTAVGLLGDKTGAEAIAILVHADLDTDVIAKVVGTSPATVRAARSRISRARSRGRSDG